MSVSDHDEAGSLLALPLRARAKAMSDTGAVSADLIDLLNERTEMVDPQLRAYAEWRPAVRPVARPGQSPPLTVTYKDLVHVTGFTTRFGSSVGMRSYPRSSARIARELEDTGVLCLGKVDTSEFGLGLNTNSRNPRHPLYSTSGSSCGSGSAVAASLCDFSIATDTLSSARNPAANCGVVAMRLTQEERWREGIVPVSPTLDAVGIVTRSCDDLNFVFSRTGVVRSAPSAPWGRQVRVLRDWANDDHDPEVRRAWDHFLRVLVAEGIVIKTVSFPDWSQRWIAWELLMREASDAHSELGTDCRMDYSEPVRALLEAGRAIGDPKYRDLLCRRASFGAGLAALAHQEPAPLIFPHDASLPRRIDEPPYAQVCQPFDAVPPDPGFAAVPSLAGLPSLCLPLPTHPPDAPLSAELVGPPHSEVWLASIGSVLERILADE
jgi:Asp-tRNA(Asn)/Glu-tRNA(Gln) amidotransferase A subunit family amidase